MILATALLIGTLGTVEHRVELDCPLAIEIAEAAQTKNIHLGGLFEEVSGVVEKTLLAAEIVALDELRKQMIDWYIMNCRPSESQ